MSSVRSLFNFYSGVLYLFLLPFCWNLLVLVEFCHCISNSFLHICICHTPLDALYWIFIYYKMIGTRNYTWRSLGTSCPMNFAGAQYFFFNSFTGLVFEQLTVASRDNMLPCHLRSLCKFFSKEAELMINYFS